MAATQESWRHFFRRCSSVSQQRIEQRLARLGVTLGEYMEIIEATFPPGAASERLHWPSLAAAARCSRQLRRYGERKALFTLAEGAASERHQMLLAGALPDEARTARRECGTMAEAERIHQVHRAIEQLKVGEEDNEPFPFD